MVEKKSVDEIKTLLGNAGKKSFVIPVSNQTISLLKHLEWDDAKWNDFINWYIKNKITVGGGHVLEYVDRFGA